MAMTWKLPVIFICENNLYAMGTSVERTSNVVDIWKLGLAYDMPAEPVDGMNMFTVKDAVERAVARARSGEGPTLLEIKTYRYRGHSMSDPAKYRTKEELEKYKDMDPIMHLKSYILEHKMATAEELDVIDESVKEEIADCVTFAENSPYPDPSELYTEVYAEPNYPFITE
jgi:pyruvate dehydrogenase E1 component alpha subunit